jgi:hypothetical protein
VLSACSEPRNFDAEIRAIDSLQLAMNKTVELLDTGNIQINDSITRQLNYIQTYFKDTIERHLALTLLRYGDFRKKAATLEQWKDSLHYRKDQIENELYAFRNTLADRSTHDRLNREITEMYADTVLQSLIAKEQQWHTKINEWLQQQKTVHNNWHTLNDSVIDLRNTIPVKKQR